MIGRLTAAAAAAVLVLSGIASAESDEGRTYRPVETWTCNYRDGKGPADLEKVIARWTEWMDDNGQNDYLAMTVTPHYFGENAFDVGWLGAWPSGEAMGAGTDLWITDGREMSAAFLSVVECDSHSNFATTELKAPPHESPPDTVVLTFSDCTVNEDAPFDDVMAGLEAWSTYQSEKGYEHGTWLMFPAFGGGDAEFDFKLMEGFPDHAEVGRYYDRYGTGGDWRQYTALVGELIDCDEARVYDGIVRRRMATEE